MAIRLTDLGFSEGVTAETILSTCNSEGEADAAPMGVKMRDEGHLTVDLFNTSQTFRNIKVNRFAVVNLTGDIEVFYRSAFKEANPRGKLPSDWFEKAQNVNAPRMRMADAVIEVSIERLELLPTRGTMRTRATLRVESFQANQIYPQVFSRAMSLTVEAIVAATRVKVFLKDPLQEAHVVKLLGVISDCQLVVNRVAPDSPYQQVMDDLTRRIEGWRRSR